MNYHYWMRSNREERSSHLRHGRKPEITHNAGQVLSELPDGDILGLQVEALAWGWHPRLVKTRSSRNSFSEWAKARKRAEMSWKKEKMMTTMIMKMILMMMTTTAAKWPWDRLRTNGHEVDYSVPSHQGHRDVELYLRFPDGMSLKAGGQYSFFITLFSAGGTALLNITFSIWSGALIKLQSARERACKVRSRRVEPGPRTSISVTKQLWPKAHVKYRIGLKRGIIALREFLLDIVGTVYHLVIYRVLHDFRA